ncbi:MAG: redoxin domain-containing protein [Verrucomicrobiia bacterium]
MKRWVCMLVALIAGAELRAADSTNAPSREATASSADVVFVPNPKDSASEVLGLRRIQNMLARRPADDSGDALRDWLVTVVVRCEQFLTDQPRSSHIAELRALDAQCRMELSVLTNDRAERDKALQLARQALAKNDRGPGAARARLVLARVAWPEDLGIVIEQTRLIIRDFSDQSFAAEAFWLLVRAQQRKGDERAVREAAIGLFGAFPNSPEAVQARTLLRQLGLVARPAPLVTVTTTDGKTLDLDELRGQALVLDFWTAATLPASENTDVLRRLFEVRHDSGLLIVGINLDTDRAVFDKANAACPTPWPQVFANDPANAKLIEVFPSMVAPTRLLVDPFGLVARVAVHPTEIEPLMKRWQSIGALASSAVPPPKSGAPVKPAVRTAARKPLVVSKRETPKPDAVRTLAPEKRNVAAAKHPSKPTAPPSTTRAVIAPAPPSPMPVPAPPLPAPQPTHIEIGGVLYAKPLSSATNALPVETTKPAVKVTTPIMVAVAKPPSPVAKPFASVEKPAKLSRPAVTAPSEPATPSPPAAKRSSDEKPAKHNRPTVVVSKKPDSEETPRPTPPAPPLPAPQPAQIEIGGTLYAKPLSSATNAPPAETTQPAAKVTTPIVVAAAKPPAVVTATKPTPPAAKRSSDEKPAKHSPPTVVASKKPASVATPRPTPPKTRPGYGSSSAKSKLKTDIAESLATMPDISESDRKAALMDAAKRILKSEEELVSWSELESLFTTKKPASAEGSMVWYQDVADRCQQFIKDFPNSSHVNLVRINEARCRLLLFQMNKDHAQQARAERAAHEVLAHKPNEDDAIRAEFLLLNATWPDHPEQGVAVAKRIVKDFPHRREAAAAMLMHAQFRRRQGMLNAAKQAAEDLLKRFPESDFAFNARSLIKQCDLLNNPCEPVKLTGLRGEKMNTEALKGQTLLIEFWSAKSKNVLEDTAKLVQLYLRYHSKGFEIYTICVDQSREAMDILQMQHPLPWPVYWDGQGYQGPVCQQFGADTAPMRFLIEPGLQRIVSTHLSPEGVAAALSLWIDQNQPPLLPGQEPPAQGFFKKFFGLNF